MGKLWRRAAGLQLLVALVAVFGTTLSAEDDGRTRIHEAGRCALRGECGKQSFFGKQLPCPDNGLAKSPTDTTRAKLVKVCGAKWSEGAVCCEDEQIETLADNLQSADNLIAACPACRENFFNLFCTFTCSPDQSLFVNVTKIEESTSKKPVVTEVDNLWSDEYGSGFYDSCKDVKVGAAGTTAMQFIGGGAKNYTAFLKFLGDKKDFIGSPFQINFPRPAGLEKEGMKAANPVSRACNDSDPAYRCTCVDCPGSCPELPALENQENCHVGLLPCLSFAVILTYSVFILLIAIMIGGHVAYRKHSQRQSERLQLLQDAAPSDDEDEGDMVHNAGFLDKPQRNYRLNSIFEKAFSKLGSVCARFPSITIIISVLVVGLMSLGWMDFAIEQDPVRLWVSPTSAAAEEKAFFDSNFGPFFRAEQAFLVNDTRSSGPTPVLSFETLQWWFGVEGRVQLIQSSYGDTLEDVCFNPTGTGCVIQSITGYFQGDWKQLRPSSWRQQIRECTDSPVDCRPKFELPIEKDIILGGWERSGDVLDAQALVSTWVVTNYLEGSEGEKRAIAWETELKALFYKVSKEAKERGLRLSFNTEISLEQELNKSTNTDAKIVVISYVVMFLYASIALGSTTLSLRKLLNSPASALVQSKFTLGISGIVIVLMSVSASVGIFSAAGIKVTLIIAEVIPFLVLAVGVDNIFLIVHEFERVNISHPDEEIDARVAKALGRMGPSILLSATTEAVAFALGIVVGMPAVRNFAIYATGAVVINAILQVTMFVAVLALNQRRVESNRADCFPFIKVKTAQRSGAPGYEAEDEGLIQKFIRKKYAPALLEKKTKAAIVIGFLGLFAAGLALIPEVALGLDQRMAVPQDSYLVPFFNDLANYFNTGPPVYFVTRDVNFTARPHQQEICGRFTTCATFSLASVLEQESKRSNVSYIRGGTASWIDDFLYWLKPENYECCKKGPQACFEDRDPPWNVTLSGMPEGEEFLSYATRWLAAPTTPDCPLGGKAAYSTALVLDLNRITTPATHFRTSHTPLRTQADFINSYASARRIADDISSEHDIHVFPYSKFYIFFDQYASIVNLTGTLLGFALGLILIITSLLLGSFATGAVVTISVIMIVTDVLGAMAVFHVSLNAVSLVNLVICVGIGVEFCAHIARAFMFPSRSVLEKAKNKFRGKEARAWAAMVNVGGSVFSGITITKLLGVCVLAFTRSKIFEIYYFRIWLALVFFAALHALVFLPVALSFVGGEGYVDPEGDGGLEEDLAARRYRALIPDEDSDDEYE